MSLQLRLSSSRERKPRFKENSRRLLRLSEVPESPSAPGVICDAVDGDGRPCRIALPDSASDPWCPTHHQEWKELTQRWSKTQKEAETIVVLGLDVAKQKVIKLRLSVELRRQIRDRFYPRGGDIQDYIKWIARLEIDVRQLADSLLMQNLNRGWTPETPGVHTGTPHPDKASLGEKIMILQSPLDPKIPIESLQGMPDDGTILILKHFYLDLCSDSIRRLYAIVPDLDDSPHNPSSPETKEKPAEDAGTDIIRAWFRIMVLNDSEAETLEHATRSKSIHDFLLGCRASQLEMYCDYFEKAWRPHAVQYLRVAICAQTLAGGEIKTIQLLGGTIPSTTEGLKMGKPCWDILYRWFPSLLTPWTLASICSNFEDYTTICKLLMLRLYREHWYDPMSILSEAPIGVYLGFLPTSKGNFTSQVGLKQEGRLWVQRESRNYLCGQMAIGHPLTQAFLEELRRRTASFYLVVYEGTHADATVHPTEPDLFISRHRSALTLNELKEIDYSTTVTLEDVKNELRMRKTSMYDPIVVDSWQFIIIDREIGLPFRLIDVVQDVLLMLVGDPSPRAIAKRVIREVIPPSVQEIYLEEVSIQSCMELRYPPPPDLQYEGSRFRSYKPDKSVLKAHKDRTTYDRVGRDTNRLIRRIVDDMERCGIVSLVTEYEEPQTRPVIIQGADGAPDLYFPYDHTDAATPTLPLPPTSCLRDFATTFKSQNETAIMAKGSIQTHYAAWPMPAIKSLGKAGSNFATWEGHIYRWNAMPFDRPSSVNAWQYYVQHFLNAKFPFVKFYLTSFVICATDAEDADKKTMELLDEMEDRGWRVTMPRTQEWTSDIDQLNLEKLFCGIGPA